MVISYEIYETRRRLVSYLSCEMITRVRSCIYNIERRSFIVAHSQILETTKCILRTSLIVAPGFILCIVNGMRYCLSALIFFFNKLVSDNFLIIAYVTITVLSQVNKN